ncbi:MAG: GNAT family N-acetyltransferase [Pseudomonadota bacterium]
MTTPSEAELFAALEATWAPAAREEGNGWVLRDGAGGGKRVSAASAMSDDADIAWAEAAMRARGQTPLFSLRPDQAGLDEALADRGYAMLDPTLLYAAPAQTIAAHDPAGFHVIRCAAPLAIMHEIWADGGIGPARRAVMARSGSARVYLLGRLNDRPAGCAFAAIDRDIAMLHALEVAPGFRRGGLGRSATGAAAAWAVDQGCTTLALAVVEANAAARALYESLGMTVRSRYHYRFMPEDRP